MEKRNNAGWIILLIAGILEFLSIFMGMIFGYVLTPPVEITFNPLTLSIPIFGILLIIFALMIKNNKYKLIISWSSLVVSILMIISIASWFFGILALIGSIISLISYYLVYIPLLNITIGFSHWLSPLIVLIDYPFFFLFLFIPNILKK